MAKITNVYAREVLDSRGNPTIEVELTLENKYFWKAIVPSGASTWTHEALELRDQDPSRFLGKWVLKAVYNVNKIIKKAILNKNFDKQEDIDKFLIDLDWTKNKSKLWANAILWVSMAFTVANAKYQNKHLFEILWWWTILPYPMMNIINWWTHADNNVDIQEFMIVPVWAQNIKEAIRMWSEVFHNLKKILKNKWYSTSVGDEWWYAPNLESNEEAFEVILEAIQKAWYNTEQIKLALDPASSEFFENWKYILKWEWKELNWQELVELYKSRVNKYPIISIEDWAAEDDFETWKLLNQELGNKIMIVWDDLLVTNMERIQMAIDQNLCNSVLIKLNQIWTVTETLSAIKMAYKNNMKVVISHRSWETEDTFIADLAVWVESWFIKTGSLSRTDRIAKYNQLIRIEEILWNKAKYWKK